MQNTLFSFGVIFILITFTNQYELGTSYLYSYDTSVLLNEPKLKQVPSTKDVGFKINLNAEITPVWQNPSNPQEQLLQLQISKPKLLVKSRNAPTTTEFVEKQSKLTSMKIPSLFVHRTGTTIGKVFFHGDINTSLLNLQKGIASLFQYQPQEGSMSETDPSGVCDVVYESKGKSVYKKVKENCKILDDNFYFNHTSPVMAASIKSNIEKTFELNTDDLTLKLATTSEVHILRPQIYKGRGTEVISTQNLRLKDSYQTSTSYKGESVKAAIENISYIMKVSFKADNIVGTIEPNKCIYCKHLSQLVNNFRGALRSSKLGSQSATIAFLRILQKVRTSDFESIGKVLTNKRNAEILPQLLDIVAASQTAPGHKAAMSMLKFKEPIDLPERYLIALSVTTHPPNFILEDLFMLLKKGISNEKLFESLVLSLSAQTKTYSMKHIKSDIARQITEYLSRSLENCPNEQCQLIFIRGLKNVGDKSTASLLLKFALGGKRKPSIYALRALQGMSKDVFTEKILTSLEKIFLQLDISRDYSCRALALGILLQHKTGNQILSDIFRIIQKEKSREFNTLIIGQLLDISRTNQNISYALKEFLNNHRHTNYHTFGQGGMSSIYSRSLMKSADANASFSSTLEMNGGILKTSTVDLFITNKEDNMKLLSFGIFAGGLSSLAGQDYEDDGETSNAGIEISLMNSQLRPFYFFTSQSELMGHVWAGTGSERSTVIQGSSLLQDHNQYISLQNGFSCNFALTGAVSYDLSGKVIVSLWNRNAHSVVEVGAALVVQGQSRIDNSFVQTMVEFNIGSQASLSFISDLDFSDEMLMCLQMVQPDTEVVENLRKMERVSDSNYVLKKYKRKSILVPGKTYSVNKKNSETCNKMLKR